MLKEEIASLASTILADPEKEVGCVHLKHFLAHVSLTCFQFSLKTSKLRRMNELCQFRHPVIGVTVCKLAMLSMSAIFKDIVPG